MSLFPRAEALLTPEASTRFGAAPSLPAQMTHDDSRMFHETGGFKYQLVPMPD